MALLRVALLLASVGVVVGDFRVKFEVEVPSGTKTFTVLVHEDWAPIGAARFKELVEARFYDDTRFFRVLPGFMVQFGLSGDAATSASWKAKTIADEPVKVTNKPGGHRKPYVLAAPSSPAAQQPIRPTHRLPLARSLRSRQISSLAAERRREAAAALLPAESHKCTCYDHLTVLLLLTLPGLLTQAT